MKEQLIELANEKKFTPQRKYIFGRDMDYYLWMCELQKWLRDEYGIYATVIPDKSYDFGLLFNVVIKSDAEDYMYDLILRHDGKIMDLKLHEQALEQGLINALKLIK